MKRRLLIVLLCFIGGLSIAYAQPNLEHALDYLIKEKQFQEADLSELKVSDSYHSSHNDVYHLYLQQYYQGKKIFNAISGVHFNADLKVVYFTDMIQQGPGERITNPAPLFDAFNAIQRSAEFLELTFDPSIKEESVSGYKTQYSGGLLSKHPINVELVWLPVQDRLHLVWQVEVSPFQTDNQWLMSIDASTGQLLQKKDFIVHCYFQDGIYHNAANCEGHGHEHASSSSKSNTVTYLSPTDGAIYNVFPIPVEAPIFGERELVMSPADPIASPYGWHDRNGEAGAEFTITRGNNAHAFLDVDGDNESNNDEPDGTEQLIFDFTFSDTLEPAEFRDAATVQLFYMTNIMHDITYQYGFNEEAGNFQDNNYGNGGLGFDPVLAHAQDGGGVNNANFGTPSDGSSGVMQMFLWNRSADNPLTVVAPEEIAGIYPSVQGTFGGDITADTLFGQLAIFDDGSADPTLACNPAINAEELAGKIALIDRGTCEFGSKSLRAEEAGAIAVLVCNYENGLVNMAAGQEGDQVTIPTLFMGQSDCQTIRQFIGEGEGVTLGLAVDDSGPTQLDGSFDNGIIAHEYGHGISNRLTGGPSASSCLFNDEQMGEGWSDFFSLITTVEPGDLGTDARGIGNYATARGTEGRGIRRQPYSTDFSINNQTFEDVINAGGGAQGAPHPLGEIWAATLWDLYWRLVDQYGWDPDIYNGTGGNNIAIQLVMDGMKFQNCTPGFIDGRNGILAADILAYDGANQCLIWEVFARRGIGFNSDQGNSQNRSDLVQAFDLEPDCVKELKVIKSVTRTINAGDDIEVTIEVINDKETTVTGVQVVDQILPGLSYVAGSTDGTDEPSSNADNISFEINDLGPDEELTFTYNLRSDANLPSIQTYVNDFEEDLGEWLIFVNDGFEIWQRTEDQANSGAFSWFIQNTPDANDQLLQLNEPILITGDQPALRFYQRYQIQFGADGGLVEASTDGGTTWNQLVENIRTPFNGPISTQTIGENGVRVYYGNQSEFVDTYFDLSEYVGQEVLFRFRFVSNEDAENLQINNNFVGWYVDDVELMDMQSYNGEVCVTSAEGDQACTVAPEGGTIVDTEELDTNTEELPAGFAMQVFPNPVEDWLQIAIDSPEDLALSIQILSVDGRLIKSQQVQTGVGYQVLPISTQDLSSGLYVIRIGNQKNSIVRKFSKI